MSHNPKNSKPSSIATTGLVFLAALLLMCASAQAQWITQPDNDIYYNAGKVGIGTTNPVRALHVVGGLLLSSSGPRPRSMPTTTAPAMCGTTLPSQRPISIRRVCCGRKSG